MKKVSLFNLFVAAGISAGALLLGSLTHATLGEPSITDVIRESGNTFTYVPTHPDVENALKYYIGQSGKSEGLFVVTSDGKLMHVIESRQRADGPGNGKHKGRVQFEAPLGAKSKSVEGPNNGDIQEIQKKIEQLQEKAEGPGGRHGT